MFRYSLKKDDVTFYYVRNGVVLTTTIPTYQSNNPKGWQDTETTFRRDMKYMGIFPEYGDTIDFVLDSAKILRSIYYTDGFEGDCILYVEKLNTTTTEYEFFYEGSLDFSTSQDLQHSFAINIMERGVSELLSSREDTEYEIPLADPDAITLTLDGVKVRSKGSWYPGNYSSSADNGIKFSSIPYTNVPDNIIGRSVNLSFGDSIDQIAPFIRSHQQLAGFTGVTAKGLIQHAYDVGNPSVNDGEYILYANTDLTDVTISGFMSVSTHLPDETGIKIIKVVATVVNLNAVGTGIVSQTTLHEYSSSGQNIDVGYGASMQGSFDMSAGTNLLITIYGYNANINPADPSPEAFFAIENGFFDVTFLAKVAPTDTKGFHYIDMLKKLVSKITDGQSTVFSSYLSLPQTDSASRFDNWDTSPLWQIISCGNALRGLPDAVIKTSLTEAFDDLFGNLMVALMVEGDNVKIEQLATVFNKDSLIATITKTNGMVVSDFKDKIFNSLKIGYGNYDNKNVVGKNEFNTGISFLSNSVKRYKKEDNVISNYRADVYGIESVRAETFGDDRLDNRADNDTFIIEADPVPVGGKYKAYRPSGIITGVDDPANIYNVTLSPGRRLRRHLPRIRSLIRKGQLVYQTTDKNPDLVSTFGAGQVVETENINLESDTYNGHDVSRLFLPYVFEFECPLGNLYNQVKNNPYGYLEFNFYGETMKGFVLEIGMTPAKGSCRCKLLSHPDNDETKLIR